MSNRLKWWKQIAAITVLAFGVAAAPIPALAASTNVAAETKGKTALTVSQIQELAVIYNPTNKTYDLNQKKLDLNQTTTANNIRSARHELNSGDKIDTSSVTAIRAKIADIVAQHGEKPADAAIAQQLRTLRQQLSEAEAAVDAAYAASASSFESAISNIKQLNQTLDGYQDEQDDLDKTKKDWETQVRMIAEVLCMQAAQYEKNIALLQEQITLTEKALNLTQVQQELGMVLTTDVQSNQVSLAESRQSLDTAEENLSQVKRQINVLIGRDQDHAIEVISMHVPVIVSVIPTYSEALVKEFQENDYPLKTYERSIANYKNNVADKTDSDVLKAADNNVAGAKLNMEERERTVADKVKSQLAKMTADLASYETSQTKVVTEKKNLDVAQQKHDLGMITSATLLQSEINYKNAVAAHWKNSYNYYLDWQEYKAMKNGIDMGSYAQYRV